MKPQSFMKTFGHLLQVIMAYIINFFIRNNFYK